MSRAKELANKLNGRQYLKEISEEEIKWASRNGLIILFGGSDDIMYFCGDVVAGKTHIDSIDCLGGGVAYVTPKGEVSINKSEDSKAIEAVWDTEGFSWVYKTDIPYETFVTYDGKFEYCRGIIFLLADVARKKPVNQDSITNAWRDKVIEQEVTHYCVTEESISEIPQKTEPNIDSLFCPFCGSDDIEIVSGEDPMTQNFGARMGCNQWYCQGIISAGAPTEAESIGRVTEVLQSQIVKVRIGELIKYLHDYRDYLAAKKIVYKEREDNSRYSLCRGKEAGIKIALYELYKACNYLDEEIKPFPKDELEEYANSKPKSLQKFTL